MDSACIRYNRKLWSPSPTLSDKNSFFHSAFGTRTKQDEPYFDKQAKFRRMRWATFLTYFENETMPHSLANILRKCWAVHDNYEYSTVDDKSNLQNYISDIVTAERNITVEEIPILATLDNVKITVLANDRPDPVLVAYPDMKILGSFVNIEKCKKEVIVYLRGDIFSRINVVQSDENENRSAKLCTQDLQLQTSTTHVFKYEKGGCAGSKGVDYQIGILTVFLLNALRCLSDWKLSTENKAAGKFDDVVLEWPEGVILLQAKHKENKKKITLEDLISVNSKSDDFSLPKYFISYEEIKTRFNIKNVIICTNASVGGEAVKFLTSHRVHSDSMLCNGHDNCTFYKFSSDIVPYLKVNVEKYYQINFQKTSINKMAITDYKLKEFLQQLQFYCDYPQWGDIGKVTEELLSISNSNLDDQVSPVEITAKVTNWFQQKNGVYLTETYSKAIFCEIHRDKYWQKLESYNVYFQKSDFKIEDTNRLLLAAVDEGCLLQEIRICQGLKNRKKVILCIRPDDDLEMQKHVMEAFKLPQYTFLIIVWSKISDEFLLGDVGNILRDVLDKYHYKKIVIVGHSNRLQHFGLENSQCSILCDIVSFKNLSRETQETILTKKSIIFQEEDVSFKQLLPTEDYEVVLKPIILERLLRNEKICVGMQISDLDKHISLFYINRKFQRKILKELETLSEKSIFGINDKVILISDCAGMGKTTVLIKLAVTIKRQYPHLWVVRIELNDYTAILKQALSDKRDMINIKELLNSKETSRLKSDLENYIFSQHGKVVLMLDGVDEISPDYTRLIMGLLTQCRQDSNFVKIFVSTRPHMASELELKLETKSFVLLPFTVLDQVSFLSNYWIYNLKINTTRKNKCEKYATELINKMSTWIKHYKQGENQFAAIPLQIRMLAEIFQQNYASEQEREWEGCREYIMGDENEVKLPEKMNITNLYEMFIEKKRNIFIERSNPSGNTIAERALNDQFEECLDYHRNLSLEIILDKAKCELFSTYHRGSNKLDAYMLKIGIIQQLGDEFHFIHRTFAEYFVAEYLIKELRLSNQNVEFQRYFIDEILLQSQFKVTRSFFECFLQEVVDVLPSDTFKSYQCLAQEISLSHRRKFGLIHRLAEEGCVATLQLLFKCIGFRTIRGKHVKISDLYRRDFQGNIPLQSLGNTLDILTYLVKQGGVNIVEDKVTPLHLASAYGHLDMVKFLVSAGADIETIDFFHQTPLHLAVNYDYLEVAKFLVEQGADIKYRDGFDSYAILIEVINKGQSSMAAYLLEKIIERGDYGANDSAVAYAASYLGKINIVGLLFEAGLEVNCRIYNDHTLLFGAVQGKQQHMIDYLISQGADVNAADKKGNTYITFYSSMSA